MISYTITIEFDTDGDFTLITPIGRLDPPSEDLKWSKNGTDLRSLKLEALEILAKTEVRPSYCEKYFPLDHYDDKRPDRYRVTQYQEALYECMRELMKEDFTVCCRGGNRTVTISIF